MPAINVLPPDVQITAPPAAVPSSSAPAASDTGSSPFETILSSAVSAPAAADSQPAKESPPAPGAATNSAAGQAAPSASEIGDDKSNETAAQLATDEPQSQPAPPSAAVSPSSPTRQQVAGSIRDSKAKTASPPPALTAADRPPPQLVSALLLSDALVPNVIKPPTASTPPDRKPDDGDPPAAPVSAASPPPALVVGLNVTGILPPVAPLPSLPPIAAKPTSTAGTAAPPASPSEDTGSAVVQEIAPAGPPALEEQVAAITTVATATLELKSLTPAASASADVVPPAATRATVSQIANAEIVRPAPAKDAAEPTLVGAIQPVLPDPAAKPETVPPSEPPAVPQASIRVDEPTVSTRIANDVAAVATAPVIPQSTIPTLSNPFAVAAVTAETTATLPDSLLTISFPAPESAITPRSATSSDSNPPTPQPAAADSAKLIFAAAPASLQFNPAPVAGGQQNGSAATHPAQLIEQVALGLQAAHSGGQALQLSLSPPDLGSLQISVSLHEGVLSARLEVQSPTTQQLLVDNLSQLKSSLTQQGVAFDRIDVSLAGSQTGSGSYGSAGSSFGQQPGAWSWEQNLPFDSMETSPAAPATPRLPGTSSRIAVTSLDVTV